jgi:hypothetical protein
MFGLSTIPAGSSCADAGRAAAADRRPLIEIVQVAEPSVHLGVAAEFHGTGFTAFQLVYADDRGHWPWERGFRGGRGGQPVLGARADEAA